MIKKRDWRTNRCANLADDEEGETRNRTRNAERIRPSTFGRDCCFDHRSISRSRLRSEASIIYYLLIIIIIIRWSYDELVVQHLSFIYLTIFILKRLTIFIWALVIITKIQYSCCYWLRRDMSDPRRNSGRRMWFANPWNYTLLQFLVFSMTHSYYSFKQNHRPKTQFMNYKRTSKSNKIHLVLKLDFMT